MDLLEKASIILTPTAYNNGEALCVKPSDGSGDFDFSRNSAATRVNAQGLVENVQILSSNLVQNGDFSEEGAEEVSNGSFSQEGSEEITNGDFSNGLNNWSVVGGSYASVNNGVLNSNNTVNGSWFGQYIAQDVSFVNGKTYKITFKAKNISGNLNLRLTQGANVIVSYNLTSEFVSYTSYYTSNADNGSLRMFCNDAVGQFEIDNVSVREVGQDWTLGTGWSIGEDKANGDGSGTAYSIALQSTPISALSGNTIRLEYTISNYVSGIIRPTLGVVNGLERNSNGTFIEYIKLGSNAPSLQLVNRATALNGSITNISVKEVGQNWDLETGFSIGEDKAFATNASNSNLQQTNITISNTKKYKINFTINDYTSGSVRPMLGAVGAVVGTFVSANGTYTEILTANNNFDRIVFRTSGTAFNGSITNISVIEITDDTNLPRINYEGFSYQDALGSELYDGNINQAVNGGTWIDNGDGTFTVTGDGTPNIAKGVRDTNAEYLTMGKNYLITAVGENLTIAIYDIGYGVEVSGTSPIYFTPTTTSTKIYLSPTDGISATYSNVSVKEYLGQEPIPNSGCGSWLWEPQSTNLITYSSDFSDASWFKGNTSVIANQELSPSGIQDADKVTFLAVPNANIQLTSAIATTIGEDYTYSIYAKADTNVNNVKFGGGIGGDVDLAITDSWQRFSVTFTATSTTTVTTLVTRDAALSNIYLWGAQVEQQSYATSYIPTNGEANGVTRNQDVCTNGGSLASINSTEGTLYAEIAALANDGTNRGISINNGGLSDYLFFRYRNNNQFQVIFRANNSNVVNETHTLSNNLDFNKIAFSYKLNEFKLFINGLQIGNTITSGAVFGTTINSLDFDNGTGSQNLFGKTKALAVFPYLSDEELTELTTI